MLHFGSFSMPSTCKHISSGRHSQLLPLRCLSHSKSQKLHGPALWPLSFRASPPCLANECPINHPDASCTYPDSTVDVQRPIHRRGHSHTFSSLILESWDSYPGILSHSSRTLPRVRSIVAVTRGLPANLCIIALVVLTTHPHPLHPLYRAPT